MQFTHHTTAKLMRALTMTKMGGNEIKEKIHMQSSQCIGDSVASSSSPPLPATARQRTILYVELSWMGVWTFLWRERRPFRERGEREEGRGGREGEKEMEMGWRDGPIEKNDVMCSSAAAAWEWESSKLPGSRGTHVYRDVLWVSNL